MLSITYEISTAQKGGGYRTKAHKTAFRAHDTAIEVPDKGDSHLILRKIIVGILQTADAEAFRSEVYIALVGPRIRLRL